MPNKNLVFMSPFCNLCIYNYLMKNLLMLLLAASLFSCDREDEVKTTGPGPLTEHPFTIITINATPENPISGVAILSRIGANDTFYVWTNVSETSSVKIQLPINPKITGHREYIMKFQSAIEDTSKNKFSVSHATTGWYAKRSGIVESEYGEVRLTVFP